MTQRCGCAAACWQLQVLLPVPPGSQQGNEFARDAQGAANHWEGDCAAPMCVITCSSCMWLPAHCARCCRAYLMASSIFPALTNSTNSCSRGQDAACSLQLQQAPERGTAGLAGTIVTVLQNTFACNQRPLSHGGYRRAGSACPGSSALAAPCTTRCVSGALSCG